MFLLSIAPEIEIRSDIPGPGNPCDKYPNIALVETHPPNQIIGVDGIKGTTITYNKGEKFTIFVTPNTQDITLHMTDRFGVYHVRKFELIDYIKIAIKLANASASNWQKSQKKTEQNFQEKVISDKKPSKIVLLSPDVTPERNVFRIDSYQTYVRGKVSDNEGVLTVLVNGKKTGVKEDGSFAAKLKLALGASEISVQAEDINGNVAERTFTIIREEFISEETLVDVDMPPKTKMKNPDGLAVIIGVESYQYVPDATYAYNDAEVFREYLADTMGFSKARVKIATNSKATLAEFNKLLGANGWLARNVKQGKSDVVVYFSGHGIPDAATRQTGLLPFDVDPNYSVGLPLKELYAALGGLGARSVTVFLDACFTGETRENRLLLADSRNIMVVPREEASGIVVVSAAAAGQTSGALTDKEHGIFTYYVLKGLGGEADGNGDKQLTLSELAAYVRTNVKEQAAVAGREQIPELQGDAERVLVAW